MKSRPLPHCQLRRHLLPLFQEEVASTSPMLLNPARIQDSSRATSCVPVISHLQLSLKLRGQRLNLSIPLKTVWVFLALPNQQRLEGIETKEAVSNKRLIVVFLIQPVPPGVVWGLIFKKIKTDVNISWLAKKSEISIHRPDAENTELCLPAN